MPEPARTGMNQHGDLVWVQTEGLSRFAIEDPVDELYF